MRAVVYKRPMVVAVEDVEDARIETETDAVIRISTAGICGSDLHMYEGRTEAKGGVVFGHENMGVIERVGNAVKSIRPGDRVVLPFNASCGFCFNCARGCTQACLTTNPEGVSGGYGYVGMGPYRGGQADLLRVPFADFNCLKLPGSPGDELEDDFLLLSDVFPTGFHAAELARVGVGSTVAVYGAGPVGLAAAYSSLLRGASEVYVVDQVGSRLAKAHEIGAHPIDFSKGDPAEQIRQARKSRLAPGEGKMGGVMCGIDAVGYEARSFENPMREDPSAILKSLSRIVNPTGSVGIVGVYFEGDPGAVDPDAGQGVLRLPLGALFEKGISIGMGQCPVKRYNAYLRDLIISGRARPGFLVSHRLPLSEAPLAYRQFDKRAEGVTKVLLKPGLKAA